MNVKSLLYICNRLWCVSTIMMRQSLSTIIDTGLRNRDNGSKFASARALTYIGLMLTAYSAHGGNSAASPINVTK